MGFAVERDTKWWKAFSRRLEGIRWMVFGVFNVTYGLRLWKGNRLCDRGLEECSSELHVESTCAI